MQKIGREGLPTHSPEWYDEGFVDDLSLQHSALSLDALRRSTAAIEIARSRGLLPVSADRVFEFGSGEGSVTVALHMFAQNLLGASELVVSEAQQKYREKLQATSRYLPIVSSVETDGVSTMLDKGPFDFIVGQMFGAFSVHCRAAQLFVKNLEQSLAIGGVMWMYSDQYTVPGIESLIDKTLDKDEFTVSRIPFADVRHRFVNYPHLAVKKLKHKH